MTSTIRISSLMACILMYAKITSSFSFHPFFELIKEWVFILLFIWGSKETPISVLAGYPFPFLHCSSKSLSALIHVDFLGEKFEEPIFCLMWFVISSWSITDSSVFPKVSVSSKLRCIHLLINSLIIYLLPVTFCTISFLSVQLM